MHLRAVGAFAGVLLAGLAEAQPAAPLPAHVAVRTADSTFMDRWQGPSIEFQGALFFSADRALWRSDGTPAGTQLIKAFSTPEWGPHGFVIMGGDLYFRVFGSIWRSDGTTAGTQLVFTLQQAGNDSNLAVAGDSLFFTGIAPGINTGLWRSDGTTAGTTFVAAQTPPLIYPFGNAVLFRYQSPSTGYELGISDGTPGGTVAVKDVNPGAGHGFLGYVMVAGSTAYFTANDGIVGTELWKTDGTSAGTTLVKDVRPGGSSNPFLGPVLNGVLFFVAEDGARGRELWKTDGTTAGTEIVEDVWPGLPSGTADELVVANGILFFRGHDGGGDALWRSDGTAAGTQLVKPVNPQWLTAAGASLFFVSGASGPAHQRLWRSDGTDAGTQLVSGAPTPDGWQPDQIWATSSQLFFSAGADYWGTELWRTSLLGTDTKLVRDLNTTPDTRYGVPVTVGAQNTVAPALLDAAGTLFFAGFDAASGVEIWRSDGTTAGTTLLRDIHLGTGSSAPTLLGSLGGLAFFSAIDASGPLTADGIWKSDGTFAGTTLVATLRSGSYASSFYGEHATHGVVFGGKLYFATRRLGVFGGHEAALWVTDGTAAGTQILQQFGEIVSMFLVPSGNALFIATTVANLYPSSGSTTLYRSDGTAAGTELILQVSSGCSHPCLEKPALLREMVPFQNGVAFVVGAPDIGYELWKSDGTIAGSGLVKDIAAGSNVSSTPSSLTTLGSLLYFSAWTETAGRELWRSDGTEPGTFLVVDLESGSASSSPEFLANLDGLLMFAATVGGDTELWRYDEGVSLVRDIQLGGSSRPSSLTALAGLLYFSADNGPSGREPWRSNGETASTLRIDDVVPGIGSSNARHFTLSGGKVFFVGLDQLYVIQPPTTPRVADFDGDGVSDLAVYHPPSGLWYVRQSSNGGVVSYGYGGPGYLPIPGEYGSDGKVDLAVYHSDSGLWFLHSSADGTSSSIQFGGAGYTPVRADFDADGKRDPSVYYPPLWYTRSSATGQVSVQGFGGATHAPWPADYDGDWQTDLGLYEESTGRWSLLRSSMGTSETFVFGGPGYQPVRADFGGDGIADVAVYHEASGLWFVRLPDGSATSRAFGAPGFQPVPADYDGDGRTDLAVYETQTGLWYWIRSSDDQPMSLGFGGPGFAPVN
jgi:ELWxxDGT repeat protein